jgi:flagellar basal body-associated protein FliL
MVIRLLIATAIILGVAAGPAFAGAKEKAEAPGGSTEIQAKLSSAYIAVPRLHMPVQVDANRAYRALDLEVWLLQADPEKHQALNSKKKQIAEAMREDFSAYDWEAFEDSAGGPTIAKKIVVQAVQRVTGTAVEDVMIKTLLLK